MRRLKFRFFAFILLNLETRHSSAICCLELLWFSQRLELIVDKPVFLPKEIKQLNGWPQYIFSRWQCAINLYQRLPPPWVALFHYSATWRHVCNLWISSRLSLITRIRDYGITVPLGAALQAEVKDIVLAEDCVPNVLILASSHRGRMSPSHTALKWACSAYDGHTRRIRKS